MVKPSEEFTEAQREGRYSLGWFLGHPTEKDLEFYSTHGYMLPIPEGWVPKMISPAGGYHHFPAGFVLGWRKIVVQPPRRLSDEEALAVLEKMEKPQIAEKQSTYRNKVESAIIALMIDAKRPMSKLDINRKLDSDFPVREVSSALTRLARGGELSPNRVYRPKQGYRTLYSLPPKSA